MSKLCVARKSSLYFKHVTLVPAQRDTSDGREDRTKYQSSDIELVFDRKGSLCNITLLRSEPYLFSTSPVSFSLIGLSGLVLQA